MARAEAESAVRYIITLMRRGEVQVCKAENCGCYRCLLLARYCSDIGLDGEQAPYYASFEIYVASRKKTRSENETTATIMRNCANEKLMLWSYSFSHLI